MDIINVLLQDHATLRGELANLTAPFTAPPGTCPAGHDVSRLEMGDDEVRITPPSAEHNSA